MRLAPTLIRRVLLIIIVTSLFLLSQYYIWPGTFTKTEYSQMKEPYIFQYDVVHQNQTRRGEKSKKLILLWSKFFGSYQGWYGFYGSTGKHCCKTCTFSHNRSQLQYADAVLIHAVNLYEHGEDLPTIRYPHQVWILQNTECPTKTWLNMDKYDNVFNWTSMVRSDSDVPVFYGKTTNGTKKDNIELIKKSSFASKTSSVAWAVSNCYSDNSREDYVRELQNHIPVDVFGFCEKRGRLKCPRWREAECLSKYKFYLAFENSNCRDYVTEKLWRTYKLGIIPVVRGGGNYTKVAPPGSYINTADFTSPKHLANYLMKVGNDEKLYMSYMRWHRTHRLLLKDGQYWCDLCQTLQARHREGRAQVYRRLGDWFRLDTCFKSWLPGPLVTFLRPLLKGDINLSPFM